MTIGLLLAFACRAFGGSSQVFTPIKGLREPAEVRVDRWGIAHIYARSQDDAFFVQGFNAARDRLFQIDLWRRRGLGQLSEVFGPAYADQDRATRLFLYRGDMSQEWLAYGPDTQRVVTNFVAGINAYIDSLAAGPNKLPLEFRLFKYVPARWSPEDVVRIRSHALAANLESEVARAKTACNSTLVDDERRIRLQPSWVTQMPDGLDPCLPKDVLRVFRLATQPVHVTAPAMELTINDFSGDDEIAQGSNSWVISPRKSATGRAILANDPHRAYATPSLRYLVHLNAPGLNVIGAGEPAVPGVSLGHNDHIAFGLTIFSIDQQDLYVERLNPDNPDEYWFQDHWEHVQTQKETIVVRGAAPVSVELKFTLHGPLIYVEAEKNRAYAVRSVWMQPGTSAYLASLSYIRAQNWKAFSGGINRWGTPGLNLVYADVQGNIGWTAGGKAPIRPNWDGLLPVPGDGRYEWGGFWSRDQLPSIYNPSKGWFSNSNEMNLPSDYPVAARKLGFEWEDPSRHRRIEEVLASKLKVSLADSMRLQNDRVSIPARRLVSLLSNLSADEADTRSALALLKNWDGDEQPESAAAALTEVWLSRHLRQAYVARVAPAVERGSYLSAYFGQILDALEHPEVSTFGTDPVGQRDVMLLDSLTAAYRDMEKLQGSNSRDWQWGRLLHNESGHPLAEAVEPATREKLNVGRVPVGGGGFTPNVAPYNPENFQQISGPSVRIVVDVGHWDQSWAINFPGQSGDPDSSHYRDLVTMWKKGEYFPLRYSRAAVEQATETVIRLVPQRDK